MLPQLREDVLLEKALRTVYPNVDSGFGYIKSHSFLLLLLPPAVIIFPQNWASRSGGDNSWTPNG